MEYKDHGDALTDDAEASLLDHPDGYAPVKPNHAKQPNWPVCKPVIYHNISEEVKSKSLRRQVWTGYVGWYVLWVLYFWNAISVASVLFGEGGFANFVSWLLSILYILGGIVLGFFVYKKMYDSAVDGSGINYATFCCLFFAQTVFCLFLGLGIPTSGGSGLVLMITTYEAGFTTTSILNFVSLVLWGGFGGFNIWHFISFRVALSKAKPLRDDLSGQIVPESTSMMDDEEPVKTDAEPDIEEKPRESTFAPSFKYTSLLGMAGISSPKPSPEPAKSAPIPAPIPAPLISLPDAGDIPKQFL